MPPRYEKAGKAKRVVKAQQVWHAIIESQTETGTPYMLYKDACNKKSNQQNLGTIKSSNLCTEIVEYTSHDEVRAAGGGTIHPHGAMSQVNPMGPRSQGKPFIPNPLNDGSLEMSSNIF